MSSQSAQAQYAQAGDEADIQALYYGLLNNWNMRDAAGFAALYAEDGSQVGFDGSEIQGRAEIEAHLSEIFADHQPAAYVGKIREVRFLLPEVAMLRAVAGMVPPGGSDVNPAVNAIQALVAVKRDGQWRVALYQNTPAQFHGRPEAVQALTEELRQLL